MENPNRWIIKIKDNRGSTSRVKNYLTPSYYPLKKLTWQRTITDFKRKYIYIASNSWFSIVLLVFRGVPTLWKKLFSHIPPCKNWMQAWKVWWTFPFKMVPHPGFRVSGAKTVTKSRWFKPWPFHPPIVVGGHLYNHPKKGHVKIHHPKKKVTTIAELPGFFCWFF